MSREEIQDKLQLTDRKSFIKRYIQPAKEFNIIEMTIPDKPNSSKQKYRLTKKGLGIKEILNKERM